MVPSEVRWKPTPSRRWDAPTNEDVLDSNHRYVKNNMDFGSYGFDPENPQHIAGLRRSMEACYRGMSQFRKTRIEFAKQVAGAHYAERDEQTRRVIQQYLGMFIDIYTRFMVAHDPRVIVTRRSAPAHLAADLEIAINKRIAMLGLGEILAETVRDSMYGIGVLKIGRELGGDGIERTFAANVDLDSLYLDITARRWEQMDFIGDEIIVPFEAIYYSPTIDRRARAQLKPDELRDVSFDGSERASALTGDPAALQDPFMPKTEIMDVWLPRYRQVVTIVRNGNIPINVVDWQGPAEGPYQSLYFDTIPAQVFPLAPLHRVFELHDTQNMVSRKLREQARRQKVVHGVAKTAEDEGHRITQAQDGEVIAMDRPTEVQDIKSGGIDQPLLAYSMVLKDLFSWQGGNLNALGGLSPGAETLGQDEMLYRSAGAKPASMQETVVKFTRNVVRHLAHYDVRDPYLYVEAEKPTGLAEDLRQIPVTVRMYDYLDILLRVDLQIDPYSLMSRSPGERMAVLWQIVTQVGGSPWALAQGTVPDTKKVLEIMGRYQNMPELHDVFTSISPQALDMAGMNSPSASQTRHEYVRYNRPGGTEEGKNRNLVGSLMGARQNPDEEQRMVG